MIWGVGGVGGGGEGQGVKVSEVRRHVGCRARCGWVVEVSVVGAWRGDGVWPYASVRVSVWTSCRDAVVEREPGGGGGDVSGGDGDVRGWCRQNTRGDVILAG